MEKQLKIEMIIFDMDGLMFDTEKISFTGWKDAAALYGYEVSEGLFQKTIGGNLSRTKNIYLEHFGGEFPFEKIRSERAKITEEIVKTRGVTVKRGLYELLDYLNQFSIKKAVATSSSRERAFNLLRMANVDKHFDYILCGDEIKNSKPNPEIFLKVAEKLNCIPEHCLVLEDSELGIMAAFEAGMTSIIIPDMVEPSDRINGLFYEKMNSLLDVKNFLEGYFDIYSIA